MLRGVPTLGEGRPKLQLDQGDFFILYLHFLNIHYFLLAFICFFVLFHSCRFRALVLWTTYMHKFYIFYSPTQWNLLSSLGDNGTQFCMRSAVKLNSKLTLPIYLFSPYHFYFSLGAVDEYSMCTFKFVINNHNVYVEGESHCILFLLLLLKNVGRGEWLTLIVSPKTPIP